jgi:uncharacterized protein YodC (DUF2158 family)
MNGEGLFPVRIGDVVMERHFSTVMTVSKVLNCGHRVECNWFDGDSIMIGRFLTSTLFRWPRGSAR